MRLVWTLNELAEEAARRGRPITPRYLITLCRYGLIRWIRPGRDWLIPDDEAQQFLDDWTSGGPRKWKRLAKK